MWIIDRIGKRRSLHTKWSFVMWFGGIFFLALLILAVFFGFRRFVVALTQEEAQTVADMITKRIDIEMWHLRHDLIYSVSSNARIADILRSARSVSIGATEEDVARVIAQIDKEWPQEDWDTLRARYLDAELNLVCEELSVLARLPVVELFMTDQRGVVVGSTGKTTDYYQADEEWWQRAFNGGLGSVHCTEIQFDESSHAEAWALAAPIYDAHGEVQGVVKVVVDKVKSFRFLLDVFLGEGGRVGLLRSDGKDIFSMGFKEDQDMAFLKPLSLAVLSSEGSMPSVFKTVDGRRFIGGWARLDAGLLSEKYDVFVYCLKDYREALSSIARLPLWFFVLWAVFSLAFWFVSSICVRRFLSPLLKIKQGFETLGRGHLECRLDIRTGDEMEDLAEGFNRTVEDLRRNTVSRDYFEQIIQQMSDMLIVTDGQGRIQKANSRACEVLEHSPASLVGLSMTDIVARKDRYIVNWGLKGNIEEGQLKDKRVTLITRSGREVPVYLGTRGLRDAEKGLTGLVCVAKDLTEINRLLDVLKKTNQEVLSQKEGLESALREQEEMRDVLLSVLEDTTESKRSLEKALNELREKQD